MFRNSGKLRWYQGPAKLVEVLAFIILIKEKENLVYSFKRSKNLEIISGKINISDWCTGVMEGFELLIKDTQKKTLKLTTEGQNLYELIHNDKNIYSILLNLIEEKKINSSSEGIIKEELFKNKLLFNNLKDIIFNSEQFFNAAIYLSEYGVMSENDFKSGFFERMMLLYNGEIPVDSELGASTSDNRLPFIYQFGEYFGLLKRFEKKLDLSESLKLITISESTNNYSHDMQQEKIDFIDNQKVNQSVPILDVVELANLNNRTPEKNKSSSSNLNKFKTNPRIAKTAIKIANYECEYGKMHNEIHITFTSKFGYQYVEAHHLVPMSAQSDYENTNLDRVENIVSLCPICHASIHYGNSEERMKILEVLYNLKISNLLKVTNNFSVTLKELFLKYYK